MRTTEYEMILCIVNTGYSSEVMNAAKKEGARGGTVLHARGTANKDSEEFFNITIEPEKEIVLLIVPNKIKDNVLKRLYDDIGLNTKGQGIAFSVPVNSTVGLNKPDTEVKENKTEESN